jgi:hypothetical protein
MAKVALAMTIDNFTSKRIREAKGKHELRNNSTTYEYMRRLRLVDPLIDRIALVCTIGIFWANSNLIATVCEASNTKESSTTT